jgi:8-oxo-dGTP diphosphatase
MLHRKYNPNINKWNGVGGKLEPGEMPEEACIREVAEETGLTAHRVDYRGVVTFGDGSGMYVFTTDDVSGEVGPCAEGTLEWKLIDWVLIAEDVAVTLPYFLKTALGTTPPQEYAFTFTQSGHIIDYEVRDLAQEFHPSRVAASLHHL